MDDTDSGSYGIVWSTGEGQVQAIGGTEAAAWATALHADACGGWAEAYLSCYPATAALVDAVERWGGGVRWAVQRGVLCLAAEVTS